MKKPKENNFCQKKQKKTIKISHLAIDSTERLQHNQNYDQQAKDTLMSIDIMRNSCLRLRL